MLDSAAVINAMGEPSADAGSGFDSSKIIDAMKTADVPASSPQKPTLKDSLSNKDNEYKVSSDYEDIGDFGQVLRSDISGLAHKAVGGVAGSGVSAFNFVKNLAAGDSVEVADQKATQAGIDASEKIQSNAYRPESEGARSYAESPYRPGNIIGSAIDYGSNAVGGAVDEALGPTAGAIAKGVAGVAPLLLGFKSKAKESAPAIDLQAGIDNAKNVKPEIIPESNINYSGRKPTVSTANVTPEPVDLAANEKPQIAPEDIQNKAAILQRIGLEKVRENVLKGDKFGSATDYQISKSPEAAGEVARNQLEAERNALDSHAQNIIKDTGGTIGMDEYTVHNRGNTIAKPFDDYRDYFDRAEKNLYKQADEETKGLPVVKTDTVESLLNDRTFKNTLMAQKQEGLLASMKDQLDNFKETNPNGLTVKNVEQFRQWLNKNYNHENSHIIAEVKSALDNDTFSAAGSDVYNAARAMHQLKIKTLDAPNSMAKLFDKDPNEPLNRRTPVKDIPDKILKLDPDNFKNVLDNLRGMPEELQPQAQAAIAEIKAQAANKIHELGSQNQVQWNARGVNQFIKNNGAKLDLLFDKPEEVQKIADLQSAGNLLRVETSYPGAAAQTQQFLKRGVGTNLITPATTVAGEGLATLLGMPMGIGGATGSILGSKISAAKAEKAAAKKFEGSVTNLNEITKVKK